MVFGGYQQQDVRLVQPLTDIHRIFRRIGMMSHPLFKYGQRILSQINEVGFNILIYQFLFEVVSSFVVLTLRLLDLLQQSAHARIVNVASIGQQALDFENLMLENDYSGNRAYCQSKLAQIMFTIELAGRLGERIRQTLAPVSDVEE